MMARWLRLTGIVVVGGAVGALATVGHRDGARTRHAAAGPRVERRAPRPSGGVGAITRRDARLVARRFAAAYAAWDAGRRDRRTARRLERATTRALFAALDHAVARPVAGHPRRLAPRPLGVYATDDGSFLVPLLARGGVHIATLVVIPTPTGARVAQLER